MVLEEVARLRPRTAMTLDTSTVSACPVQGDAGELRRLVRNVLENAVRHARSTVRVSCRTRPDGALLEVADDGPGVAESDRDRVFDRFWTSDRSRSRDARSGSGLGLAIARAVATRHGGTLEVAPRPGSTFVLSIPARPERGR